MKKLNIILISLFVALGFYSCQEDEKVTINPNAETGNMTFKLNTTQYTNYTYVLEEANNALDMDAITTQQPDYGFTAAVTYYIQASFTEDMKDSVELASSVQGENVALNVKDMNTAIKALYGGDMPNPSVAKDVYVRLRAIISTATPTPLDTIPTVKPLYSNVVKLNILPYYIPNVVYYYEAKVLRPYYIIGYSGWNNDAAHLGSELIPLGVVEDKVYNESGDGIWKYTGYFEASKTFKLIRDIGSWVEQWGNQSAEGIDKPISKAITGEEPSNFKVPSDGYYTITLNSITNELTIEADTKTPTVYTSMGLTGNLTELTGWGTGVAMTAYQTTNNHVWYISSITLSADATNIDTEGCKFRSGDTWIGGNYFPIGITGAGTNILFKAGTYTVIFNDISGVYYFIEK